MVTIVFATNPNHDFVRSACIETARHNRAVLDERLRASRPDRWRSGPFARRRAPRYAQLSPGADARAHQELAQRELAACGNCAHFRRDGRDRAERSGMAFGHSKWSVRPAQYIHIRCSAAVLVPPALPPKAAIAPPPVASLVPTAPRVSQPQWSDHDVSMSLAWRADLRSSSSKTDFSLFAETTSRSPSPAAQTNRLLGRNHDHDRAPVSSAIATRHAGAPQSPDFSPMPIARHYRSRSRSPDHLANHEHDRAYGSASATSRIDRDRAYGPAATASHFDHNSKQSDLDHAYTPRDPRRPPLTTLQDPRRLPPAPQDPRRLLPAPLGPQLDGTLVPAPVAEVDRFRAPIMGQCKGMVPFIVTTHGGTTSDLVPHLDMLGKVIVDAQFVHIGKHDQVVFYVPKAKRAFFFLALPRRGSRCPLLAGCLPT
ncbi:hypothetical protein AMAG_08444 [Allomyces macrogynus ATCC 38327]|uniref:Uncharacterized protein n=1 Tax=Allomyces macrogynus (strain ATCC 38327) TaxID=578462 RepID=A0A0L0SLN7_ALLM3|nr:hypothetical protein AMAG_08444 [Allomyces macrogynus ATCC 38327]|eukprot:KNE63304.1 hypothetical protein AMAG_08444 [Allomyces macrogynus ATCC 38327]